jgi:ABC-type polysaccharide/polyol phosphate transport system ATPase subunit
MNTSVIHFENVSLQLSKHKPTSGFKWQFIKRLIPSLAPKEHFWVLRNINFNLKRGEGLGIVGNNGAGKSTLLRLICGVYPPDEGSIRVRGKVSALLSLGAGMIPTFSGSENIYISGSLMGLSKDQINVIFNDIVYFAELEDFIDTPIKYYSSGMKARLGFSIAMHMTPDIIVIDEILGAGDKNFKLKAQLRMHQFIQKANAVILVSHNMAYVKSVCTYGLWLEKGQVMSFGPVDEVVDNYIKSN